MTPPIAWDTSLVSRLGPGTPALAYLEEEALAGRPLRIPAPVLTEISFGLARAAQQDARFAAQLEWIEDLMCHPKVEILAIGREAGFLVGRLRALAHHPPDRGRRDARTKPERRVSWLLDLGMIELESHAHEEPHVEQQEHGVGGPRSHRAKRARRASAARCDRARRR